MHKFKNKNRQGAQLLAKYGYVEYGEFRNMIIKQLNKTKKVYGYFCANCKYLGGASQNGEYKLCTKLQNAEVTDYGCCNLWEFKDIKPQPAPVQAQPEPKPEPAPTAAPTPKQVAKSVAPAPVKEESETDEGLADMYMPPHLKEAKLVNLLPINKR